jgi:hypothetical protein
MPNAPDSGFDAAVMDRENQPVALVQVKARPVDKRGATILQEQLASYPGKVDFVILIDPHHVRLFRPISHNLGEPIVQLDTPHVLQLYDPELDKKRVFEPYLLTLVEAWLRDLAYHWKSRNPPGQEELGRAGLLRKLEGGTTQPLGG